MTRFLGTLFRRVCCLLVLAPMLAGCAHVHFAEGAASLDGQALVFGRLVLVRDGETGTLGTFGTAVMITSMEAIDEPRQVTEPFDASGRFYWRLAPGRYLLEIGLNPRVGEIISVSFRVPASSRAYYFGDLVITGAKRFDALGAANVGNPAAALTDHFEGETAALRKRNPRLTADVERLEVRDMTSVAGRRAAFGEILAWAPSCCESAGDLPFEKLGFGPPKLIEIGQRATVFQFPEGRSYFAAFELPTGVPEYEVSLRSVLIPSGIPGSGGRVFVPTVVLLDERFQIVERAKPGLMHPMPAEFLPPRPPRLEGQFLVSPGRSSVRYMVVYTTEQLLGPTLATTTPVFVPVPGGVLPTGIRRPIGLEPWITGRIMITLLAK